MPLTNETPTDQARQQFCRALKAARERKQITLAQISDTTKIPASLFEEFERNDLHRWPKALFRRSFFRDYVRAIGEPVAETCAEFVRLFPDEEAAEPVTSAVVPSQNTQADDRRLLLDSKWHEALAVVRAAVASAWARVTGALQHDDAGTPEPMEETREWVSDARRVEGARPRLRVRIKLPQ